MTRIRCDNPAAQIAEWQRKGVHVASKGVKIDSQATEPEKKTRKSKYGNQRVEIGGIKFDSKREAKRWLELVEAERAGTVTQLERQVRFKLAVGDVPVCDYLADFVYVRDGSRVVEDVKGMKTPVYRLKKKLMLAIHGVEIMES